MLLPHQPCDADFLIAADAAVHAQLRHDLRGAAEAAWLGNTGLPATATETARFLDQRRTKGLILLETEEVDGDVSGG